VAEGPELLRSLVHFLSLHATKLGHLLKNLLMVYVLPLMYVIF
jgi:hypothetical protein